MRSKAIWALLALNGILLSALLGQGWGVHRAYGQATARASDYIMIPGQVVGGNSSLVYIVDTQNALLSARTFDGNNIVDKNPPIDLDRVFGRTGARR